MEALKHSQRLRKEGFTRQFHFRAVRGLRGTFVTRAVRTVVDARRSIRGGAGKNEERAAAPYSEERRLPATGQMHLNKSRSQKQQ